LFALSRHGGEVQDHGFIHLGCDVGHLGRPDDAEILKDAPGLTLDRIVTGEAQRESTEGDLVCGFPCSRRLEAGPYLRETAESVAELNER
jgi:hypothetical protein